MDSAPSSAPLPATHHSVEVIDGTEWIVVRAARSWFVLIFLALWLTGWIFGGIASMSEFALDWVWLVGWAAGLVVAVVILAWQFAGRSRLGVQGGALVYSWSMPVISKTRRFDPAQVRNLRSASSPWSFIYAGMFRNPYPPFFPMIGGSLAFDYGARTIRLLPEVDEAEGRMIAEWLAKRLPGSAKG